MDVILNFLSYYPISSHDVYRWPKYLARLWIGVVLVCGWPVAHGETLRVAVAANLQPVFDPLAAGFTRQGGVEIEAVFGSSGKFYAQIVHGAPFHLFLSADMDYPARLHREGHTLTPPRPYALGTLVLWSGQARDLGDWQAVLRSPAIRHVAVANPETAPYGREARKILNRAGLAAILESKLVFGESIAQANQFITTGAAEVGFTAKSVVLDPAMAGRGSWLAMDHDPIPQGVVVLAYARDHESGAARRFFDHLFTPEASTLLHQYGYLPP